VLNYYKQKGVYRGIDANKPMQSVFSQLMGAIHGKAQTK